MPAFQQANCITGITDEAEYDQALYSPVHLFTYLTRNKQTSHLKEARRMAAVYMALSHME